MMELLIVISIIALITGLVAATTVYAQRKARLAKTQTQMQAIALGLTHYKKDWGDFPEPISGGSRQRLASKGVSLEVGGAEMLYQALTGDGSNKIRGGGGKKSNGSIGESSDGESYMEGLVSIDNKSQNFVYKDPDRDSYLLTDAFGSPYQYKKFDKRTPGTTRNKTYDLWSYGLWDPTTANEREDSPEARKKWLTNW